MKYDSVFKLITTTGIILGLSTYFLKKKVNAKYINSIKIINSKETSLISSFVPFKQWYKTVSENLLSDVNTIENIRIIEEYKFGSNLGFLLMNVKLNYEKKFLPGFVVLRGPSCAVLMWYKKNEEKYVLMIRQPRVATGKLIWEVPAGMLDGETNNIKGKMIDEIKEETGIFPEKEKLMYLGTSYSSCGITDEQYIFFSLEINSNCVLDLHPENLGTDDEIISNIQVFNINEVPTEDVKILALKCLFLDMK
jgi:8-oxo-dGTP pyrophosphatase MutT (NUDIX family)